MAKVGKEDLYLRSADGDRDTAEVLRFTYVIDVSTKGVFSTTLPPDIVQRFQGANIQMNKNRLNRDGYLSDITLDALKSQVTEMGKEYLSRGLVSETLVIKYGIKTTASYCISHEGEIVPNAGSGWLKGKRDDMHDWKNGTERQDAQCKHPFGMQVYARPFIKQIYQYRSGNEKAELLPYHENSRDAETRPNLHWLSAVCSISPDGLKIQEMVYTEEVAAVFVNMLKSICMVNERIKDFISPEAILLIASSNQKLL